MYMTSLPSYHMFKNAKYFTPCLLAMMLFFSLPGFAQKDTSRKPSVDIISSYKPVLRNAVKINFSGSQLQADTSKTVKGYQVPSQNLMYSYQPVSLKPLALEQDTNLYLGNRNYLKAGFGNYNTPYLKAGLGFGDGKTSLVNLYGFYTSSKGTIKNQDYSELTVRGTGSYYLKDNEVYADASIGQRNYNLYGYDHELFDFKKSEVRQNFQEVNIKAGIRNTATTPLRISYNPNVQVNIFNRRDYLTETSFLFDIPVEKKFGDQVTFKVAAKGDFTNYKTNNLPQNISISNNLVQLSPELVLQTPRFKIHGGLTPVWDNGEFALMPNIYAEAQLQEKIFLLQAGWVGRMVKNTYRNLSYINPYLGTLSEQLNTREQEIYGGIKATIGKHFNFSAKAGLVSYTNLPLFINDTSSLASNKQFLVSNEPKMNNLRIHGALSYINQDKFTVTAGLTLNGYTNNKVNEKAWNTVPLEFSASMRWWAFERFMLKSDFFMFSGGKYLDYGNVGKAFSGGSDFSVGAEYKVNKQFSAFLDLNNIFANKYQRWHNYEVYGFNALGGIIVRF